MIAMFVTVAVVAVFMEEILVAILVVAVAIVGVVASFMEEILVAILVVVVAIVEVVVSFMEEVMVFVVLVVFEIVEVDVHTANDIDPKESANILSCFALEFTQETPQSICLKDVAPMNIPDMSVTAETSHTDRSWLKDCAP